MYASIFTFIPGRQGYVGAQAGYISKQVQMFFKHPLENKAKSDIYFHRSIRIQSTDDTLRLAISESGPSFLVYHLHLCIKRTSR